MKREEIRKALFDMADEEYKKFHARLIPNVNPDRIIGVRTPRLREFAKSITDEKAFMEILPHEYYEENNLHGFLIERIKDYDECVAALDVFFPYVDNWATCDMISPAVFKKNRNRLITDIKRWLASEDIYAVRFAIGMLMKHFLDESFKCEYMDLAAGKKSEEYYINMMKAWYFATALAKQYDAAVVYFEEHRLEPWIHNKSIQKAVESSRVSAEKKQYLRGLKLKRMC